MKTDVLFSSATTEWETPHGLFSKLNNEFRFTLDVAATNTNALCAKYYTKADDALSLPWRAPDGGAVWCNPPYGKDIEKWVRKAYRESASGQTIVMLIPARTDTKWFHDWVYHKAEIVFLRGRLHYGLRGVPSKNPAAFPSMVVIYNGWRW